MLRPKKLYLLIAIVIASWLTGTSAFSQTITDIEYFIDDDPGVGLATQWPSITPNSILDLIRDLPEALGLPDGLHTLYIRAKDSNGIWGFTEARPFIVKTNNSIVIPPAAEIEKIEYFIDNDPGQGNGINIPVTQGAVVDINTAISSISPVTLTEGFHTVGIRARNTDLVWGFYEVRQIIVKSNIGQTTPTVYIVEEIEYFFDDDPGVGLASKWPSFTQSANVDLMEDLPEAAALTPGQHVLVTRAKNANGDWGFYERRQIIVKENFTVSSTESPITRMEYYIDGVDPGTGNGQDIPVTPSTLIDLNTVDVATSGTLVDGQHTITVRAMNQDGVWSMSETSTFDVLDDCTQPTAAFTPQLACAGQPVTFVDNSTNLQPDAAYRWYLDGDDTIDDTTIGNASFTYDNPGTYTVSLAIRQGTICLDSISNVFTIKPLPAVVFSSTGTTTNQATTFEASTVNLDPAATWSWDFDSDGTPESTNPNTATHTYTVDGSYTTTLTVSDGLGCEVTVTKSITVGSGGGTVVPQANFLASNGCTGSTINFIDLSRDLPLGATYSWDFDGDGVADDTVIGSTSYVYGNAGSYSAKLTIDLGGSSIENTQLIEIIDRPQVDLQIIAQCYGQESQMIDLTQDANSSANYSWDFNNDGLIDDTTVGNTSFTYNSYDSYIVKLTVDNGGNCIGSAEALVEFADAAKPNFSVNKLCEAEEVIFTNLSTDVNPAALYSWDFDGDGLEDSAFPGSTAYTFANTGTYNATLTIDNGSNCLAFVTIPLDVTSAPAVDLGPDEVLCEAGTVILDAGSGYSNYSWPDGSADQTYAVDQIGEYIVKVQDAKGCFNTDTIAVKLLGPPRPAFEYNVNLSLDGITLELANTSENYKSILWDLDNGLEIIDSTVSITYTDFSFFDISSFTVCLTAINDCEEAQYCEDIFISPTQLLGPETDDVEVYPNPVYDELTVILRTAESSVALLNMQGKVVWREKTFTNEISVPMSGMRQGPYILLIEDSDRFMYKKIVKK